MENKLRNTEEDALQVEVEVRSAGLQSVDIEKLQVRVPQDAPWATRLASPEGVTALTNVVSDMLPHGHEVESIGRVE